MIRVWLIVLALTALVVLGSSPPGHIPPPDFHAEHWYPRNLPTVHPPWKDEQGHTLFPLEPDQTSQIAPTTQLQPSPSTLPQPSTTVPDNAFGGFTRSDTSLAQVNFNASQENSTQHVSTETHETPRSEIVTFLEDRNRSSNEIGQTRHFADDTPTTHRMFESASAASSFHFSRSFHTKFAPTTTSNVFHTGSTFGTTAGVGRFGSTMLHGLNDPQSTTQTTNTARDFSVTFDDSSSRSTRSTTEEAETDFTTTADTLTDFATTSEPASSPLFPQPPPSEPSSIPISTESESTTESFQFLSTEENEETEHQQFKRMSREEATTQSFFEPATPRGKECRDLLFVLDASGTQAGAFEEQKLHVKTLANAAVLPAQRQVALIVYSSNLRKRVAVQFSESLDNIAFARKVNDLAFMGGITATESALVLAASVVLSHPQPVDIVLLTDGFSFDNPAAAAEFIRTLGPHRIFATGSFEPTLRKELEMISGEENVFIGSSGVEQLAQSFSC